MHLGVEVTELSTSKQHHLSIDMYNNDVGERFMKYKGALTSATLYLTS
jgi:hypothetical protein